MPFGRLALLFAWACCAFPVVAQPANKPQPGNPSGLTELELPARRQVVPPGGLAGQVVPLKVTAGVTKA